MSYNHCIHDSFFVCIKDECDLKHLNKRVNPGCISSIEVFVVYGHEICYFYLDRICAKYVPNGRRIFDKKIWLTLLLKKTIPVGDGGGVFRREDVDG